MDQKRIKAPKVRLPICTPAYMTSLISIPIIHHLVAQHKEIVQQ